MLRKFSMPLPNIFVYACIYNICQTPVFHITIKTVALSVSSILGPLSGNNRMLLPFVLLAVIA